MASIDKQAVLDVLEYLTTDGEWGISAIAISALDDAERRIKALPTVDFERPTGTWIFCEDMGNDNGRYFCSNCLHSDVHAKSVIVPYCWQCGAKMEEEQNAVN